MPESLPRRELIRRFRLLGFEGPFSGGRHQFMVRGTTKVRVPNPHRGDVHASLATEILKQAGVTPAEWEGAGKK